MKKYVPIRAYIVAVIFTLIYPLFYVYTTRQPDTQNKNDEVKIFAGNPVVEIPAESENKTADKVKSAEDMSPIIQPILKRKIQFGVVVEDYRNSFGALTYFEEQDLPVATVSVYKQFGMETNKHINVGDLWYAKSKGKTLLVTWEPTNPLEGTQSVDYLAEINKGTFDSYIREFSVNIKNYGNPVILRFGHEMNGNWYPWGGRPEEYIKAYRRIVEILRANATTNVKYMWSINSNNVPESPISNVSIYYPGDSYVDLIGIDGFNFGNTKPWSRWLSFDELFGTSYKYLIKTYNKPIILSEIASTEHGGNKDLWINDMFNKLNTGYTKVEGIVWFNLLKETDWRVNSSDSSLRAFKNNIQ